MTWWWDCSTINPTNFREGSGCFGFLFFLEMGVSKNNGTPKSSSLIGFSIIFTIHFGGPPLFWETSKSTRLWERSHNISPFKNALFESMIFRLKPVDGGICDVSSLLQNTPRFCNFLVGKGSHLTMFFFQKCATKKKRLFSVESWLFKRDPYNGLL